jgi:hypothetical protein
MTLVYITGSNGEKNIGTVIEGLAKRGVIDID